MAVAEIAEPFPEDPEADGLPETTHLAGAEQVAHWHILEDPTYDEIIRAGGAVHSRPGDDRNFE